MEGKCLRLHYSNCILIATSSISAYGCSLTTFIFSKGYDVSCSLCPNKIATMANVIIPHEQLLYNPCSSPLLQSPNSSKVCYTQVKGYV